MIRQGLPAPIRENDEQLSSILVQSEQMDSRLAEALWECYSRGYYKAFGFRSVQEYLRERWAGTDMERAAGLHARSVQRLLKEYRLASEIPIFKENFDVISRSNRRIIARILTRENADEWIELAKKLTARELDDRVQGRPEALESSRQRLYLSIYPQTREIWERAKAAARRAVEADGADPNQLTDALCLEMICADFLGAFEPQAELLPQEVSDTRPLEAAAIAGSDEP